MISPFFFGSFLKTVCKFLDVFGSFLEVFWKLFIFVCSLKKKCVSSIYCFGLGFCFLLFSLLRCFSMVVHGFFFSEALVPCLGVVLVFFYVIFFVFCFYYSGVF